MEWLGQILCSCGSFSMICQRSFTDWEKCLPFVEKGVTGLEEGFGDVASDGF